MEKTGSGSGSGRNASCQSGLSRSASVVIVSQRSTVEVCNRLHRPLDLLFAVHSGDKHSFELRGREVDPALEQMTEQSPVACGVRSLSVAEVAHRRLAHEQRRHRSDSLHGPERRQARLESRTPLLELLVVIWITKP